MDIPKKVVTVSLQVDRFKEKYTCSFALEWGSSLQGFGGWKINNDKDYQFWADVIKGITGKDFVTAKEEPVSAKAIIDFQQVHGIGNSSGTYWVVNDDGKPKVLDDKDSINEYFSKHEIKVQDEQSIARDRDNGSDREI